MTAIVILAIISHAIAYQVGVAVTLRRVGQAIDEAEKRRNP